MKTLIVIAFAAVALLACLPEPSEAQTSLTYDRCQNYLRYTLLKLRWTGQWTQDKVCTAMNNFLICFVYVHENANGDLTDDQKTELEDYVEMLVHQYGFHCQFDVDAAIEHVRRKRSV